MLTIVTGNPGKYKQIATVLGNGGIFAEQKKIDLIEPQSNDLYYVSAQKAKQAFAMIGGPVVVDDSGIFFDAYPNFPGVFSKYMYQSLGIPGLQRLFIDQPNTHVWYQCVLSYMDLTLSEPKQFIGKVEGNICFDFLDKVEIDTHLQYDAFFLADGMDVVAQMDKTHFESFHHRTRASIALREFLLSKD